MTPDIPENVTPENIPWLSAMIDAAEFVLAAGDYRAADVIREEIYKSGYLGSWIAAACVEWRIAAARLADRQTTQAYRSAAQ